MTEIRIEWTETSPHSKPQSCSVHMRTEGIEGVLDAFRAVLVGMGYTTETAGELGLQEGE